MGSINTAGLMDANQTSHRRARPSRQSRPPDPQQTIADLHSTYLSYFTLFYKEKYYKRWKTKLIHWDNIFLIGQLVSLILWYTLDMGLLNTISSRPGVASLHSSRSGPPRCSPAALIWQILATSPARGESNTNRKAKKRLFSTHSS